MLTPLAPGADLLSCVMSGGQDSEMRAGVRAARSSTCLPYGVPVDMVTACRQNPARLVQEGK